MSVTEVVLSVKHGVFEAESEPAVTVQESGEVEQVSTVNNTPTVSNAEQIVPPDNEIDKFQPPVLKTLRSATGGLAWGFLFTLLYWVSEIVTASLILIGLGQPPLILESFVIQLILAILMMMPLTPGSSGIAEVGATTMYALFIPASIVGIFVVIWRIVMYYFNIALGIGSSLIIVRREAHNRVNQEKPGTP